MLKIRAEWLNIVSAAGNLDRLKNCFGATNTSLTKENSSPMMSNPWRHP